MLYIVVLQLAFASYIITLELMPKQEEPSQHAEKENVVVDDLLAMLKTSAAFDSYVSPCFSLSNQIMCPPMTSRCRKDIILLQM